jgi:Zn-finger nucleic acid-binding protein
MSDTREDFIDPDQCPKCGGYLFDLVDRVDGSHYIGCHTPGCKRVEYEEYDHYDAAEEKAMHDHDDLNDNGLI